MRIVTLLPSATDIVVSLGLEEMLVGVSHECNGYQNKIRKLTSSAVKSSHSSKEIHQSIQDILKKTLSIYKVKFNLLKHLNPDVIITQSQCNVCAVSIDQVKIGLNDLIEKKPKLIDLKPNSFSDVCNDIIQVGHYLGVKKKSNSLVIKMNKRINTIQRKLIGTKKQNVLCVEWLDPIMTAGNWIPDLLEFVNAKSFNQEPGEKSLFMSLENIPLKKIDSVIFMPCGFKIRKTKREIKRLELHNLFEGKDLYIVDGERYFNRPGPKLLESVEILSEILHPAIFKARPGFDRWIRL